MTPKSFYIIITAVLSKQSFLATLTARKTLPEVNSEVKNG